MNEVPIETLIMTIGEQALELRYLRMEVASLRKELDTLKPAQETTQ